MARFNEILTGRFSRALQKITGIKGAAPTPQLGTEIMPTFQLFWGVENRVLEGWQRYATFATITATAAQVGGWRLVNPAGSNVIGVVEKVQVVNTNASPQIFQLQQNYIAGIANLIGTITCSGLDNRFNPTTVNNNLISSFANTGVAAQGTAVNVAGILAGQTFDFILFEDQEITLSSAGGSAGSLQVLIVPGTNLGFQVCAIWRERFLEDSERLV
jgi:hypothetical protein